MKCQSLYLPREYSNVTVAAVYIAPSSTTKAKTKTNANEALQGLYQ